MWPREYQFFCYMKEQGVLLSYLRQGVSGMFRLRRGCYTPDFHDEVADVFYEVVGTRQAFHKGVIKYIEFKTKYPDVCLRFVSPDGATFKAQSHINMATITRLRICGFNIEDILDL